MPDANTLAIGAYANDGNGTDAGHIRIYTWNGTTWVQKGADIDGEAAGDWSGYSVSMPDANTLAIGALGNDGNGTDAGHVRIYTWNGTSWVQKLADIDGEAANDYSGTSVSMPDANTVAIGADGNAGNGSYAGHVRVFDISSSTSTISPTAANINLYPNPTNEQFTIDVGSLTGTIQLKVVSVEGKEVLNTTIQNKQTVVTTKKWEKGIYIVQIINSNRLTTIKLIKQ
ncbi:T9SS type A sorting domain-containing protein [Tenuifilum osseticum]|uniref:T9SS type A sorting domain-containing protein n=1 Tax=Tenuifilum osseticum TaxID=3374723 RepID=UPI0034E46CDA